jgi:hypothetical protein
MAEDSDRAKKCHQFLASLGGIDDTSPNRSSEANA